MFMCYSVTCKQHQKVLKDMITFNKQSIKVNGRTFVHREPCQKKKNTILGLLMQWSSLCQQNS